MIEGLKPYTDYKESGLPWLGNVPLHWTDHRLDRLFDLRNESPEPNDERVTGYLNGRVTLRTNVQGQKIKGVVKDGGWKRVYPGDFAISGMNAHLGGMGVSDSLGKCSPIYLVLKLRVRSLPVRVLLTGEVLPDLPRTETEEGDECVFCLTQRAKYRSQGSAEVVCEHYPL